MADPETTNTIMLDQAQVDAAEAAQAAQENGGEEGDYVGRRPSSSGRDSKRYRKCRPVVYSRSSYHLPLLRG